MAVVSVDVASYADVLKRLEGEDRKLAQILEILNKHNPVVKDMLTLECNDGTGHKTTVRTGIPQAAWRILNYGVPKVKSSTASVRDATGMLEIYAECDKKLAELSGNPGAYRLSEGKAIMEGMGNQVAETIFYGNQQVNPERFTGLAPRYSTGVVADADSANNVFNAGGTDPTSNTSIWLITWDTMGTHALYPKGTKAGLQHQDLGEVTLTDSAGGQYQGLRDHYEWDIGLSVRDWRKNARIANIDTDQLNDVTYVKNLLKLMISANEQLPIQGEDENAQGTRKFYMPKPVRSALRFAILDKIANNLTWETVAGRRVMMFDGTIVEREDAIISAEAVVPFS